MNGDLLTRINFQHLLDYHREHKAQATMCVREYDFQVPFGVVRITDNRITGIDEKPLHSFFVNAGIYVLDPELIDLIPDGEFFDMTTLFEAIIAVGPRHRRLSDPRVLAGRRAHRRVQPGQRGFRQGIRIGDGTN